MHYITKPNQKVSKSCPICSDKLIENHFKDLVCHCQGKCLDLKSLEQIARKDTPIANRIASIHKFKELHEPVVVRVLSGYNTVNQANNLKTKGFDWNPIAKVFFKKYNKKQDSTEDVEFLLDFGFQYEIKQEQ